MDFKKHIEIAWNLTLRHVVALILLTLVMFGVSFLTLGILGPVTMAGYMQAILRMMRDGREPKIQDLFSEMQLFLPLLGFGIVVFIATMVGFMLLVLPGIIVMLAVTFCCIYMLPLMSDRNMGLVDAIKQSYEMSIKDNVVEHLVVVIIFLGVVMIGSSVFVGALFTQPLATIFLLSTYEEKIRA